MSFDSDQETRNEMEQLRNLKPRAPKIDWELIQNASSNRLPSKASDAEKNRVYVHQPSRSVWLTWSSGVLIGAAAMFVAVKMIPVKLETPKTRTLPSVESLASGSSNAIGKPEPSVEGWEEVSIRRADLRFVDQVLSLRDGLEVRILTATKLAPVEEISRSNAAEAKALIQSDEVMNQPFVSPKAITPKVWGAFLSEWDKPTT